MPDAQMLNLQDLLYQNQSNPFWGCIGLFARFDQLLATELWCERNVIFVAQNYDFGSIWLNQSFHQYIEEQWKSYTVKCYKLFI